MTNKAFTLIELLVVVLIIGILSAIALPQYQKAVLKSRYTQLKILAHAIANAQEIYYLANNQYATRIDDLDVNTPAFTRETTSDTEDGRDFAWGSCWIVGDTVAPRVGCSSYKAVMRYYVYQQKGTGPRAGVRRCATSNQDTNSPQNQLCKAETGATSGEAADGGIYWDYQ